MLVKRLEDLLGVPAWLVILLVLSVLLFLWAHKPRLARFLRFRKLPPGPWGLPLVGYLPFLDRQKSYLHLREDAKKYGRIFGFQVGCQYLVVLDSFEAVKECYSREEFFGRPDTLLNIGPDQHSILDLEPPAWKEAKRFFLNTLRLLGIGSKDYQVAIMGQIKDVVSSLKKQQGKDVNVVHEIEQAVNNATYHLLYRKHFEHNHPMISLQQDFAVATLSRFEVNGMKTFFPLLGLLASWTPAFQKSLKVIEKMDAIVKKEIKEHRQTLNPEEPRDYVDHYLLQLEKSGSDDIFSPIGLVANVKSVLVGASDTTRLSLSWFILCMAAYQDAQEEVRQEIDSVFGREREANYSDRVNLPKTEAAIFESMRYRNIIHFNIIRTAMVNTTLCGFDIPKNTFIIHPMTSQNHNPEYWKDPGKFDLNRFLSEDKTKVQVPEHFVPFSYGKRNCPGEKVALTNMFLFAVTFLQNFKILPPEGGSNLDINVIFNNRPAHPYAQFQYRE